ncbi:hypothetical protein LTR09_009248 [Extremus antarcticus]|uniref:RBR-type E3 ubiquitin transferase n=1 Tax=Extremus antarcticus TaxID=702011 RepID=A0AAJ0DGA9_9PEZI|nr:hypothetical protein LTR09_009248 [Extremus antarcticus]
MADYDEREEELKTLSSIFPELSPDSEDFYCATLEIPVSPAKPLLVRFLPVQGLANLSLDLNGTPTVNAAAYIERDVELAHLPPLTLHMNLPEKYPEEAPPDVRLEAEEDWLPKEKLSELEQQVRSLWDDYGRCQILFSYIDYLRQGAEQGFDLDQSADGCLVLPMSAEQSLLAYDSETKQAVFNETTQDCGICLEPKKGVACYQLPKCGHVFCKSCLQDFYNNAISEGDVANIRCLSPDCGKSGPAVNGKIKRRKANSLHPRDLLAMGVDDQKVRRYVDMKRKKKLEANKNTVYCPRTWCVGPAKSPKYPPIPVDLGTYAMHTSSDDESDEESTAKHNKNPQSPKAAESEAALDSADRLAVCEKCSFAFCRVCFRGWHGQYARCFPRNPNELSAEEKASYDYILANTSPCPTCNSPTQKAMGCNHMKCFNCNAHFCYLCGAWLDGDNPYQHYNKSGTDCYQRLWELEEGDDGQAPEDGRGFAGNRRWEVMAIEAAREAEAQEAAAAAQAEEDARTDGALQAQEREQAQAVQAHVFARMARIELGGNAMAEAPQARQAGNARQRNPFPAQPRAAGAAMAVRNHERQQGGQHLPARPALNNDERRQAELQRFLDMAERDEEEGWDSDEFPDDEDDFRIR